MQIAYRHFPNCVVYYNHSKGIYRKGVLIMYTRVIVNELGEIEEYVSDLTGAEVNEILDNHPEWKLKIIPYDC